MFFVCQRGEGPGAEHTGRLAVPHRLRARRAQPAAHAPARHRARLRALRHTRRRPDGFFWFNLNHSTIIKFIGEGFSSLFD